jgi:glycosyltransferase involved in cell wall biosynthesis
MSNPRVSVGLPVYNGERYLAQTIEAVLAQTFADFELIISDNASTDRTAEIAQRFAAKDKRIQYHRNEENIGAPRNYNRTFELSTGEYFKWIAADDSIAPEFLERCVAALDGTPDAVIAYTRGSGVDKDGNWIKDGFHSVELAAQKDPVQRFKLYRQRASFGAWPMLYIFALMRSSLLKTTRLHGLYINSDSCMIYELLFRGRFVEVPEYLSFYRAHLASYSTYASTNKVRQNFFNPSPGILDRRLGHSRLYVEYFVAIAQAPLSLRQKLSLALFNVGWLLRRPSKTEAAYQEALLMPEGYAKAQVAAQTIADQRVADLV